jgi:hypothetical protein
MPRVIEGITIHWWGDPAQNPQFQNVVNYLCRAGGNTSAHFVATGTNRQVACIVSPGDAAWHSGNTWGNARTIGIELDPRARPEDYDVAAELVADIRSAYGDVPIYWHSYFTQTTCPGVWDPYKLDELSYTKFSHSTDWGKGGNKTAPTPAPTPTPAAPAPAPVVLFKLLIDGKQVGAYSTEANVYRAFVDTGRKGTIMLNGTDVTAKIVALFNTPSPTSGQPDSGKPVVEKDDYEETKRNVNVIWAFLTSLFSGFNK